jgi:hypothetical protein
VISSISSSEKCEILTFHDSLRQNHLQLAYKSAAPHPRFGMARHPKTRSVPSNLFAVEAPVSTSFRVLDVASWVHLIQTRPFMVLGGAWLATATAALIALGGLMSPGELHRPTPSPDAAPVTQVQPEPSPPAVTLLPLWTLGLLVSGCAVGTFILSVAFKQAPARSRKATRAKAKAKATQLPSKALARSRSLVPARASKALQPSKKLKKLRPYAEGGVSRLLPADRQAQPSYPPAAAIATGKPAVNLSQPTVTVVPPNETHPLDWGEESLAHLLDMRKQHPLSSIL